MGKVFARFYIDGHKGMGSDSLFILDGRNKLGVQIRDCRDQMHKLRYVQPRYNGFKIFRSHRGIDEDVTLYSSGHIFQLEK